MGLTARLLTLMLLLSLGIFTFGTQPGQANDSWSPGFYAGWISFSARIDTTANWSDQGSSLDTFVIEKFEGRGQLMVKIDNQGAGGPSIVIPVSISLLDYGKMTLPNGTCTFSSSVVGQTNYVRLRGAAAAMDTPFQEQINLVPGLRFTKTNTSSFGELKGCDQAGNGNLKAMKTAMKVTTAQMKLLSFNVNSSTDSSVGGSCTIDGWEKTTAIPNATGQGVRSLPQCTWRVFKVSQPNGQKGWK